MTGIYKITSPLGRVYIGQSRDINRRWIQHRSEKRPSHEKYPIVFSLVKYGAKRHSFEVIHELPVDILQRDLDSHEQLYIDLYRDSGHSILNVREAGSVGSHSEETKKLLSLKGKARVKSKEHLEKIINKNILRTGYKMSKTTKDKIRVRALKRGMPTIGFTGRNHTEESRKKISIAGLKRRDSEETKIKKSIAAKKRPPKSAETCLKISLSKIGKPLSSESIAKRESTKRANYLKRKGGVNAIS